MKAGWKTVKLGHIGVHVKGSSMPAKESRFESWSVPSFETGQPEIVNGSSILAAKTPVEVGDILICKINPRINRVWRITETGNNLPSICSTEWVVFRANNPSEVLPQWVQIYCSSPAFREWITGQITGTTGSHARAKPSNIFDQEIPLPPLAEQKRIVALLDEAFAGIDEAKAKAQASIQSLRTLVVSEFQSLVDKKGFEQKPLPELASHTLGKMLDKKKNTGTPRPYLRNVNVRWFEFDLSDIHEMPIRDEEVTRCQARKGDVLMCEGGYPGRCAIWRSDEPVFFQKALHRIRFNEKWMAEWFVNYMHSLDSSGKISEFFTGTGIQHLTGDTLSKLEIPVPPKSEIEAYVKKISAIRDEANNLAANESAKLDALSELKKSLLAQAFAGELAT